MVGAYGRATDLHQRPIIHTDTTTTYKKYGIITLLSHKTFFALYQNKNVCDVNVIFLYLK